MDSHLILNGSVKVPSFAGHGQFIK
jgi:hypothetical protein